MSEEIGTVRIKTDSLERAWGLRSGAARKGPCDHLGNVYDTLTHAGAKPEGTALGWLADSPEEAIAAYRHELYMYIERHKPEAEVIHWRQRPTLERCDGKWCAYSRLSLSNGGVK